MKDKYIMGIVGIICLTALGITYFIFVRQDGTVLTSLSSVIGAIIGYAFGKRGGAKSGEGS